MRLVVGAVKGTHTCDSATQTHLHSDIKITPGLLVVPNQTIGFVRQEPERELFLLCAGQVLGWETFKVELDVGGTIQTDDGGGATSRACGSDTHPGGSLGGHHSRF